MYDACLSVFGTSRSQRRNSSNFAQTYFQTFLTICYIDPLFQFRSFPYQKLWQYSNRDPPPRNGGVERGWGKTKSRFATDISLCLANQTRYGHSYHGTPIGTRVQYVE